MFLRSQEFLKLDCTRNYYNFFPNLSRYRFDKREEAQEAIAQLHGTIPEGGSEPLSVKIAEEHGKQKAAYYAGWQAGYNQSRGK